MSKKIEGFNNRGSICYFNALLQCLLSSKYFVSNCELIKQLENWDYDFSFKTLFKMEKFFPNQCSLEYFLYFMEFTETHNLFKNEQNIKLTCSVCDKQTNKKDILYHHSMNDDLTSFFQTKEKVVLKKCDNCGTNNVETYVETIINKSPPIMVFSLNKFDAVKGNQMNYALNFDITRNNVKERYILVSVVLHFGTREAGHYIAFVCRNDRWYIIDDRNVVESNINKLSDFIPNSYLLFYEKY